MTISVLQENGAVATTGAGLTSLSITLTLTAGSCLHVLEADFSGNTITVSDGVNTYVPQGGSINNGSIKVRHYIASNVVGGSTTITVSSSPAAGSYLAFWVREIGGCSGLDASSGVLTTTTTTTNGVVGTAVTAGSAPGLLSVMGMWVDGSNVGSVQLTTGTAFTTGASGLPLGSNALQTEQLRYTSAGSQQGAFTGTSTGQHIVVLTAAFHEFVPDAPGTALTPRSRPGLRQGTPISRLRRAYDDTTRIPPNSFGDDGGQRFASPRRLLLGTPRSRLRGIYDDSVTVSSTTPVAAAGTANSTAGALLTGLGLLTASAPANSSVGANLAAPGASPITADATADSTAGAALAGSGLLAADAPSASSTGAALGGAISATTTAPAGSSAAATLGGSGALAADGPAGSAAGAVAAGSGALAADSPAGSAVGALSGGAGALAADSPASSSVGANLASLSSGSVSGDAPAGSAAGALIAGAGALTVDAMAGSATTANVGGAAPIGADAPSSSSGLGALIGTVTAAADAPASSLAGANLTAAGALAGAAPSGSAAVALPAGAGALAASATADSAAAASLANAGTPTAVTGQGTADSVVGALLLGIVVTPPTTPPTTGGGLLPGQLGAGMGPYKRPGQVFGEQDPLSPNLTSRAPRAAAPAVPLQLTLPTVASAAEIVGLSESDLLLLLLADHL